MIYPFDITIMADDGSGTPHLAALAAANPGLEIRTHTSARGATPAERNLAWRNCDRNIRAWWQANREAVRAPAVLFAEYDVFCNVDLRPMIPAAGPGVGLIGAALVSPVTAARTWPPFAEIGKLPHHLTPAGVVPLGFLLITRQALDSLLSPEWDEVFAQDIFCELRLPTLIQAAGYALRAMPLPDVGIRPLTPAPGARGIFHPVKDPVPQ